MTKEKKIKFCTNCDSKNDWQYYGVGTWLWDADTREYYPIVLHCRACRICGRIQRKENSEGVDIIE